jgi:haloalkane dehalogenase
VTDALRTPDDRFTDLPDYPFPPRYVETTDGLRMHYAEAGPADGPVVLLLHGQPTWSFLYRHVLSSLAEQGIRAIAPDLIGYGRSDKPVDRTRYSLTHHIGWVGDLVEALDLQDITLVAQDWGGPIGLGALARTPDRFARVVAANTILHTADEALAGRLTWAVHGIDEGRVVLQEALVDYLLLCLRAPELQASLFVRFATTTSLSDRVLAAYDAPFPDETYKAGLRQMTALLPLTRNDPGAQINRRTAQVLRTWSKPFVTAYSDGDPATHGWAEVFQELVPGAAGQPHTVLTGGHFLQEDAGPELAAVIARAVSGA